jgi:hypothetical protein
MVLPEKNCRRTFVPKLINDYEKNGDNELQNESANAHANVYAGRWYAGIISIFYVRVYNN